MRSFLRHRYVLILAMATVALLGAGCASSAQKRAELDAVKISATLPDGPNRQRWETAEEAGTLPPVSALPKQPKSAVRIRQVAQLQERNTPPRRPVIPKQVIADVQEFSSIPVTEYRGSFEITRVSDGLLVGRIAKQQAPLELHYRLPGDRQKLPLTEKTPVDLTLRSGVEDSALQRLIVLHTNRAPILLYISEGSAELYRRTIEEVGVTVEQLRPNQSVSQVKITRGESSITLKPGESGRLDLSTGPLNVRVLQSLARSPQATLLSEGQQHYVTLIAWQ